MSDDVIGYARDRRSAVVASNRAEITLEVPPDQIWEYERLTVRCSSTTLIPRLRVYDGAEADGNLVDGTDSAQLAIEDAASPVRFDPGSTVRFVVTNADNGATLQVNAQRRIKSPVDVRRRSYDPGVAVDPMPRRDMPNRTRRHVTRPYGGGW